MNIDKAFPSKYMKAADLDDKDLTLTIKGVAIEELGKDSEKESKPVLYFEEEKKGFALNKTNANIIKKLYGSDTDAWIGKKITLWPNSEVPYGDEIVTAIRVRSKAPVEPDGFFTSMESIKKRMSVSKFFVALASLGFEIPEDVPADKKASILDAMSKKANEIEQERKSASVA